MKLLKVLAIGVTVGGFTLAMNAEKAHAEEWTPRTVEQIKADMKGNEYTIVWGDTLSGISQATNQTVQSLAERNSIANVDLIYAGNKLLFNGDIMTVQNPQGETIAQSVIQDSDKIDPTKPVGQSVQGTTNSATQNTTTPSTGNTGTTTPSTPENNGGVTQTPTQPDNNGNQNGSTGNTTTPSQPSTGGNQNNSGNSNGGTTTPSQPNNGGNSGTTTPSKPQAPTIVSGYIGNTGKVFDTDNEATAWAEEELDKDFALGSSGKGWTRYVVITIYYSDGTEKFSVSLYKD